MVVASRHACSSTCVKLYAMSCCCIFVRSPTYCSRRIAPAVALNSRFSCPDDVRSRYGMRCPSHPLPTSRLRATKPLLNPAVASSAHNGTDEIFTPRNEWPISRARRAARRRGIPRSGTHGWPRAPVSACAMGLVARLASSCLFGRLLSRPHSGRAPSAPNPSRALAGAWAWLRAHQGVLCDDAMLYKTAWQELWLAAGPHHSSPLSLVPRPSALPTYPPLPPFLLLPTCSAQLLVIFFRSVIKWA
ncbi:hypothetical protein GY45DRAFT_121783 [Cubamyces sp. BRFM 1775]|nr:hypothetical protein GY45DRAFT_121783 [Cubamyces sp. BRFM 1775]